MVPDAASLRRALHALGPKSSRAAEPLREGYLHWPPRLLHDPKSGQVQSRTTTGGTNAVGAGALLTSSLD